jgi:hypothetical protein
MYKSTIQILHTTLSSGAVTQVGELFKRDDVLEPFMVSVRQPKYNGLTVRHILGDIIYVLRSSQRALNNAAMVNKNAYINCSTRTLIFLGILEGWITCAWIPHVLRKINICHTYRLNVQYIWKNYEVAINRLSS